MNIKEVIVVIQSLMVLAACVNSTAVVAGMDQNPDEAVQVADKYVKSHFTDFDTAKNPPVVQDKGDMWEVSYRLPRGVLGGTPIVIIDKKTLQVVKAYHTQ